MAYIKSNGHTRVPKLKQYTLYLLLVSWQSDQFWLRCSKFCIWPWKVRVKVKFNGHIPCWEFNFWGGQSDNFCWRYHSLPLTQRYSKFCIWPWKFKVKSNGHIWGLEFKWYVCFCFVAIGPFLAEIYHITYLILKIQGQGHKENWLKSHQVIHKSLIQPKIKENQNFFRSYCLNKSLQLAAALLAYKLVQNHQVTPSIPRRLRSNGHGGRNPD